MVHEYVILLNYLHCSRTFSDCDQTAAYDRVNILKTADDVTSYSFKFTI